jgi:hypothetical protein
VGVESAPPATGASRFGPCALEEDQVTMHVSFVGGSHRYHHYRGAVVANRAAVSVVFEERLTAPAGTIETALGHRREVVVVLDQALGSRVVVNSSGRPVLVSTAV